MFHELAADLNALDAAGLRRRQRRVDSFSGAWAVVEGRRLLVLSSNDYLGLARHPEVIAAAQEAVGRWGCGSGGSRLTSGNLALHEALERELAALKGAEAAIVFSSGYLAATGTIPALVGPGDLILSDALNHACLIDGCRLSGAEIRVYRHADPAHAEELLRDGPPYRRRLLVTDGVFSMDGDIAPLPDLVALCQRYNAWLLVDDAHATGVLGPSGGGTAEHFGLASHEIIHMGTLSKALGAQGGFIASPHIVVETLRSRARSFLFDTGLAPAAAGAALAALAIIRAEPERRGRLQQGSRLLRSLLEAGFGSPAYPPIPTCRTQTEAAAPFLWNGSRSDQRQSEAVTPILPVIVGEASDAVAFAKALQDRGVWAPAIRPPTVPSGTARLRLSVTADHDEADIDLAAKAIVDLWNQRHAASS